MKNVQNNSIKGVVVKNIIPVILQPGSNNAFYVKNILKGLYSAAEKYDLDIDLADDFDTVWCQSYPNGSSIIVIGYIVEWLQRTINFVTKMGYKPMVVNTWLSKDMLKYCDGVYCQLEEGIENIISYLYSAGKNNIALFGTNSLSLADCLKENTFLNFPRERFKDSYYEVVHGGNPLEECVDDFIDKLTENNIDAIICANDTVAIHLISKLKRDGIKVPEDIYVVGMGNSRLGQKIFIPLSSIDFNYEELGSQTISLWRFMRKNKNNIHAEVTVPCRFIIRQSTDNFRCREEKNILAHTEFSPNTIIENTTDEYYEDENVRKILKFEVFLCTCDDLDYRILESIMLGKSDSIMAEELNMTDRGIRYRISKMTKKLEVQTREEIADMLKKLSAFYPAED